MNPLPSEDDTTHNPTTTQPTRQDEPSTPLIAQKETTTSPGLVVLQWLTYAFWGWTLLALSVLTFIVIYNLIDQYDASGAVPYVLAATLVLLPISLLCDFFYRKREASKKQGASMIVMVIHAVIFALFGIGALIASIFALIQLFIGNGETNSSVAAIISFLIVAGLYALTFIRTLNPFAAKYKTALIFSIVMAVIAGTFIGLSIIGPIAHSFATKNDRRIEQHISDVKAGVDNYISTQGALPERLDQVQLSRDAKSLVDDNLITLKPETYNTQDMAYYYQLCANYSHESDDTYDEYSHPSIDERSTYITTYSYHPKGEVCYKLMRIAPQDENTVKHLTIQLQP